nr:MAG TPA: ABC transporter [Caudoviricetes sp.]
MSNIEKQALTAESARESGNIILIVAARMVRRELFTPLHYVSELPQKVVSMRVFREALERSEETLQREACKIVDGHDRMQKKLKEVEAKLEAAEKRIELLTSKLNAFGIVND